jgi:phasin family protein
MSGHLRIVHRNNEPRKIAMTDFTKLFAGMPGMNSADMSKLFAGMPGLNPEAFAATQKRNVDTLVQAGQVFANGANTMVGRQVAAFQSMIQESLAVFQAGFGAKDPQAGLKSQFDYLAASQQKALALAAELAEIAQKTGQEAFEILRKRAEDGAAEVVAFQKKAA